MTHVRPGAPYTHDYSRPNVVANFLFLFFSFLFLTPIYCKRKFPSRALIAIARQLPGVTEKSTARLRNLSGGPGLPEALGVSLSPAEKKSRVDSGEL